MVSLTLLGLDIIGQQQGDTWSYFGYDGLGSVRQVYDSLGVVGYATSYAPYGDVFEQYGSLTTNFGFTGEYTDASGLLYLRARYLNTDLGTFLTKDPAEGFLGGESIRWNGYIYVHANAINFTDPSGQVIPIIGAIVGGLIGAAGGALFGFGYGLAMYEMAIRCDCGQDRKDQAEAIGREAFVLAAESIGAAFGFVAGAALGSGLWWGPAVASGIAIGAGVYGLYHAGLDILMHGPNTCNALDVVLSVIGIGIGVKVGMDGRPVVPDPARSVGRGSPDEQPSQPSSGSGGSGENAPPNDPGGTIPTTDSISPYGFPNDPAQPPDTQNPWTWRGSGAPGSSQGNWVRTDTGEWLHWDPSHHGTPHWDYQAPDGTRYRIWPTGRMTKK